MSTNRNSNTDLMQDLKSKDFQAEPSEFQAKELQGWMN